MGRRKVSLRMGGLGERRASVALEEEGEVGEVDSGLGEYGYVVAGSGTTISGGEDDPMAGGAGLGGRRRKARSRKKRVAVEEYSGAGLGICHLSH